MGKIQWLLGWTSGINDNSKWAIFGKQNSKWAILGIHKGYIGSIHKYLWYKIIRNTDPMGSHRMRRLYFWLFYIISIYGYSFYTPYIFHIYIYTNPRYVPYIFPCVFLNLWSQNPLCVSLIWFKEACLWRHLQSPHQSSIPRLAENVFEGPCFGH